MSDSDPQLRGIIMSLPSIPPMNPYSKLYGAGYRHYIIYIATYAPLLTLQEVQEVLAPPPAKPAKKPRSPSKRPRREDRKSGLWTVLHAARKFGITPPTDGGWVRLPPEFDAIYAL